MFDDSPHISEHFIRVRTFLGLAPQNHSEINGWVPEEDKKRRYRESKSQGEFQPCKALIYDITVRLIDYLFIF